VQRREPTAPGPARPQRVSDEQAVGQVSERFRFRQRRHRQARRAVSQLAAGDRQALVCLRVRAQRDIRGRRGGRHPGQVAFHPLGVYHQGRRLEIVGDQHGSIVVYGC
jgi:hypothetical protein